VIEKSQGILDIRKVDILLLRKYLLYIKERRNLGNRTIALKIATLRSYSKFLRVSEIIKNDPSLKLTTPRFPEPQINYLTKEELLLFLSLPDRIAPRFVGDRERDKVRFHLLVVGGLRRAEILGLKWQDIDLSSGWMMVRRAKGNKTRTVPLAAPLEEALKQLRAVMRPQPEEFVLLDQKRRPISVSSFYNIFNRYLILSGIGRHVTPHSFRHSCANCVGQKRRKSPLSTRDLGALQYNYYKHVYSCGESGSESCCR
ncbi:type 1 fimbriae regulatory protein FimE, partial [Candidatus Hakubella thermalkaliphila]